MLRFAALNVPYYRDSFGRTGMDPLQAEPLKVLAALPVLSKLDLQDNELRLKAERLPRGETTVLVKTTSGTTGRPTKILQSLNTTRVFRR